MGESPLNAHSEQSSHTHTFAIVIYAPIRDLHSLIWLLWKVKWINANNIVIIRYRFIRVLAGKEWPVCTILCYTLLIFLFCVFFFHFCLVLFSKVAFFLSPCTQLVFYHDACALFWFIKRPMWYSLKLVMAKQFRSTKLNSHSCTVATYNCICIVCNYLLAIHLQVDC